MIHNVFRFCKSFILLSLIVGCHLSKAQEGIPFYTDYFADNLYVLHPSMAGAAVKNQIRLTARQQWFDQQEAPNLQTLSINGRLGRSSGLGLIAFNDKNGYHSQVGAYVTYAHHLMFSRTPVDLNQLSFGMNVGWVESRLDERSFNPNDFDPIISRILQSSSYLNVDIGASYNFLNLSLHLTVKNLLFSNRGIYSDAYESNNQRRYVFTGAYTFGNSPWNFEPSALFLWIERTGEKAFDLNFKTYREFNFGTLWAGLSYRRFLEGSEFVDGQQVATENLQYVTPVVGVNYQNFVFAYTYSYQTGNIRFSSGGFHQLTLGYDFGSGNEPYNCDCPAIN
ncbi:PorP/SprF family type IX secretion system membrane protein [Altibacter sp. HG106]|uniref:PorP/SprF family type IX secretion system membrane protein n=1 Tax=Altibacter sp. HG106 TaxID=3023937 RepID=UPI00234FB757|nr:type IX secretion system membrane protein PorP/SprF [Altibacter sp. HG106]MDC7994630.1 type IX secretion system membrane protein PorP/SprF [Altibacter sp. HG106]